MAVHALVIQEPVETIIRNTFKNLGRSLAEIVKIYFGSGRKIMDAVHIEGIEHLHEARAKGKGVLLITGHCGNWELLALSASAVLFPISILARPINNPYINKFVERARKKYGNSIIYKKMPSNLLCRVLKTMTA